MSIQLTLIRRIDAFLEVSGISAGALGRNAVNDGKIVDRLRRGGNVTVRTVERIEAFIAAETARLQVATPAHPDIQAGA